MTRFAYISALMLFVLVGCSKKDEYVSPYKELEKFPAPVVRADAPASAAVNLVTPIDVYYIVNSGCGGFGRFEESGTGFERTIKVYPKYRDGMCTADLPTRKETYEFKPTVKGTYTLQFYYQPEEYMTKTIVVGDLATIGE